MPSDCSRTLPHAQTALAKFLSTKLTELKGEITLREIAAKLGYPKGNIISMFRTGECRVPLDKIPALAAALHVDVAHLMRLGLEQYWPDKMQVITEVFSRVVTTHEMALISELRKRTNNSDPKLRLGDHGNLTVQTNFAQ